MTPTRVMDPDVYDTLVLAADEFGGVGRAWFFETSGAPCCIHGYAAFVENTKPWNGRVARELLRLGIDGGMNNDAVRNILDQRGAAWFGADKGADRVDIRELFAELGVVRGPEGL